MEMSNEQLEKVFRELIRARGIVETLLTLPEGNSVAACLMAALVLGKLQGMRQEQIDEVYKVVQIAVDTFEKEECSLQDLFTESMTQPPRREP
jgi:hypothetical protein